MKFCIFLAVSICLVIWGIAMPRTVALEGIATGTYAFYSTDKIQSKYVTNVVDLGFAYIYECKSSDADKVRPLFTRIDGESISFDKAVSTNTILRALGARVVHRSGFGVYAYTPRNEKHIVQDGKKINVQIVTGSSGTQVGLPIMLGAY